MSQSEPGPGSPSAPRNLQVLLGVFIVWQILFLPITNVLMFLRDVAEEDTSDGPFDGPVVDHLAGNLSSGQGQVTDVLELFGRWKEATGQWQGWSLFAPWTADKGSFLSVEFRWKSAAGTEPAPVVLRTPNEPDDINRYLRLGYSRFRKYEASMMVDVKRNRGETAAEAAPRWRRQIRSKVRREWDNMQAYLLWRWRTYQREHPDAPEPEEMILHVRSYAVPPPGTEPWKFLGPFETPLARFRPRQSVPAGSIPVEVYNPETKRFEYLEW